MKPRDWATTYDANDWFRILCQMGVRAITAAKWSTAFADEIQPGRFSAGMADLRAFLVASPSPAPVLDDEEDQADLDVGASAEVRQRGDWRTSGPSWSGEAISLIRADAARVRAPGSRRHDYCF